MQLPTTTQTPITRLERNWAMAMHLSAFAGAVGLPFGHVLGPLIVYLLRGHESEFIGEHGRASLNYQMTISILAIVAALVAGAMTLGFIETGANGGAAQTAFGLGIATVWVALGIAAGVVVLLSVIFIIIGTVRASEGLTYNYPIAIRFLR